MCSSDWSALYTALPQVPSRSQKARRRPAAARIPKRSVTSRPSALLLACMSVAVAVAVVVVAVAVVAVRVDVAVVAVAVVAVLVAVTEVVAVAVVAVVVPVVAVDVVAVDVVVSIPIQIPPLSPEPAIILDPSPDTATSCQS